MSGVQITWRALTQWPAGRARTPDWQREDAKFSRVEWQQHDPLDATRGSRMTRARTPLATTLKELDRELSAIDARSVVVQVDLRSEREFRADGTGPLASARLGATPGVVLTFTRKNVPHVFAADFFKRWEDNLRAIALGLDGLRRLERYHITQSGEQYRGWQALPASTTTALSTEQSASVVARHTGGAWNPADVLRDREITKRAIRAALAKTHPDAGGATEDFQLVQEAKRVLEAHHGVTF